MKTPLICFLLCAISLSAWAHHPQSAGARLLIPLPKLQWVVGLSGIVVDDDGKPFKDVFNIKNTWSSVYAPTRATVEAAVTKGWGVEASFAYSQLKAGKVIDDYNNKREHNVSLYTFDLSAKYYPVKLISKWLSPYALAGVGYTNRAFTRPDNGMMANLGFGASLWLYKGLGVNVQSTAKFAVNTSSSNYLMHAFGVVYRFRL